MSQVTRITNALEKVHEVLAHVDGTAVGTVSYHPPGGASVDLPVIQYDLAHEEGLGIDHNGLKDGGVREMLFRKSDLATAGVDFDVNGNFTINGETWNFAEDEPIQDTIVPIANIHSLILVRVRRGVEVNSTEADADFTYSSW